MWKARPEDNKPVSVNPPQPAQPASPLAATSTTPSTPAQAPVPQKETPKVMEPHRADVGHIGKSVSIRGELTGSEDLYLDGEIEGTVDLRDHSLIIGPNGRIKATISARDLIVHGRVEGNVNATGRVELRKSCTLMGDVATGRIVIEDGAFFKGAIDIRERDDNEAKPETRKPMAAATSAGSGMSSGTGSGISYNAASGTQGSFLDPK
ncbi:MAG TPA: polymer-forming cytoskeletal protein [Candidatus Angelobacter sp.]|nr:polymer-forming cytoskeletal protein [Candidatus Angelobacter sp.]